MKLRDADWYHYLPSEVKEILSKLNAQGHTTYIVGGAVRDLLLGLTPKDFDLVSSAKPEEVSGLFEKTLAIGKQFGISMVVIGDKPIEVATFRREGDYSDGRRPDKIEYATPEEDALRRDFTVNGLFWDPVKRQVIDYVGGIDDLEQRRLRCIGDAGERFREDSLRMLRALRFYSLLKPLGFSLDTAVLSGIASNKARIKTVSRERITQELDLLLKAKDPAAGLLGCANTGLWSEIFPGVTLDTTAIQRLHALHGQENVSTWTALAFCVDDPDSLLSSLILPKETRGSARFARDLNDRLGEINSLTLAEQKEFLSAEDFVVAAKTVQVLFPGEQLRALIAKREMLLQSGKLNPAPLVSGEELKSLGYSPGKSMGAALKSIRTAQLNEEIRSKEEALKLAKKLLAENQ